mgnify:CR=1 FL=1
MNLALDHVFVLVEPEAKVADLLIALGMEESFSRDHEGQGTSNRRFEYSNGMLEFLWLRDAKEANDGPGRNLAFQQRSENPEASPFGIILHRKNNLNLDMPFTGWMYQPDYFKPPMSFHIGVNSSNLLEPLCIYVPFIEPKIEPKVEPEIRTIKQGTFKSISHVKIYTTTNKPSDVIGIADAADRLTIAYGHQHLMEVTFDENQCGLSHDFRPEIPLIIHW